MVRIWSKFCIISIGNDSFPFKVEPFSEEAFYVQESKLEIKVGNN